MDERTRLALAEINRAFYAQFAGDFARTRRGWPPGFSRILPYLRPAANVLDVGCGNGRLLTFLIERGWRGRYLGVDSSPGLLSAASTAAGDEGRVTRQSGVPPPDLPGQAEPADMGQRRSSNYPSVSFLEADLLSPDWPVRLSGFTPQAIACLAVLHHIPGAAQRAGLVARCAGLLPPDSLLIVSTWQFATAPRLRGRILPWETVGLSPEAVEPGDFLLAWGQGAAGQRYCAALDEGALRGWASNTALVLEETFYADGHEGNLNLYGVFRRWPNAR